MGPLREQAEKAEKFLKLSAEKRQAELSLWLYQLGRAKAQLREQEHSRLIAKSQHDGVEARIAEVERETEEILLKIQQRTADIERMRQSSSSLEEQAAQADAQAAVLQNTIVHQNENIARLRREMDEAGLSGNDLLAQMEEKLRQAEELHRQGREKEQELFRVGDDLQAVLRRSEDSSGQAEEQSRLLSELTARGADARVRSMAAGASAFDLAARMQTLSQTEEERRKQEQRAAGEESENASCLQKYRESVQSMQNAVQGYEFRLKSRQTRLQKAEEQERALLLEAQDTARRAKMLEDLERNLEGFAHSVKAVMQASSRGMLRGIHGPVSRLLKVPGQYSQAVETALGAAMQNIVTETEQDAKSAIGHLKRTGGGRATFLPIPTIKGRRLTEQGLDDCFGYVGIAADLCTYDRQYAGIFENLLGRIVVVEDLDCAVRVARQYGYRFRVVTLDGQVVNAGGSLTGGSGAKGAGLLNRANEIEKMKQNAAAMQKKAEAAAEDKKAVQREYAAAQAELSGAQAELAARQEDCVRFEAEQKRLQNELSMLRRDLAGMDQERKEAESRMEALRREEAAAKDEAEQIARQAAEVTEAISAVTGNREQLMSQRDGLTAKAEEIRLCMLSLAKDEQALRQAAEELSRRREEQSDRTRLLQEEMETLEQKNQAVAREIDVQTEHAQALRQQAKQCGAQIEALIAQRASLEADNARLRQKERDLASERELAGRELARLEERHAVLQKDYDDIIRRMWEEYELTQREAEQEASPAERPSESQKRLTELRGQIKRLGAVNVGAVEEYKEVNGRYLFLKEQTEDVEQSRQELLRLTQSLTQKMKGLFLTKFQSIREHFAETFTELFDGGTADLKLTDPDDVLNCGIEITVRPPGKVIHNLEALSGGEKTFVAIALYFAILKVSPSPFCMMDEIEAALDDVNVSRFAAYLRRMSVGIQFIVISHRRGTMEEADMLYGVTMQEKGVSRLLELHISELEKKLGMKNT